jgi:hypothetical protein
VLDLFQVQGRRGKRKRRRYRACPRTPLRRYRLSADRSDAGRGTFSVLSVLACDVATAPALCRLAAGLSPVAPSLSRGKPGSGSYPCCGCLDHVRVYLWWCVHPCYACGFTGVRPWRSMISTIFAGFGGPPAASLMTSAASRKYCGPIAAGEITQSALASRLP